MYAIKDIDEAWKQFIALKGFRTLLHNNVAQVNLICCVLIQSRGFFIWIIWIYQCSFIDVFFLKLAENSFCKHKRQHRPWNVLQRVSECSTVADFQWTTHPRGNRCWFNETNSSLWAVRTKIWATSIDALQCRQQQLILLTEMRADDWTLTSHPFHHFGFCVKFFPNVRS